MLYYVKWQAPVCTLLLHYTAYLSALKLLLQKPMCLFVYFTIKQHNTWVCIYLNEILRKRTCVLCTLHLHYKSCLSALSLLLLTKPCVYVYSWMLYYVKRTSGCVHFTLTQENMFVYTPFTTKTCVCVCVCVYFNLTS